MERSVSSLWEDLMGQITHAAEEDEEEAKKATCDAGYGATVIRYNGKNMFKRKVVLLSFRCCPVEHNSSARRQRQKR